MPEVNTLSGDRIISGSFGYIYINGVWQSNLNHAEAKVTITKKELNLVGTEWTKHKRGAKKGTGTYAGYKITSEMIERGFSKQTIIIKLDDPEAFGYERVQLMDVMPDEISLANFTAGDEVTESVPFTFEGFKLLDKIVMP